MVTVHAHLSVSLVIMMLNYPRTERKQRYNYSDGRMCFPPTSKQRRGRELNAQSEDHVFHSNCYHIILTRGMARERKSGT